MTECIKVTLTGEMVKSAFERDSSLRELVNPNVISLFESSTFVQTESGGWCGEGGFYGENTAMGRVLGNAIRPNEKLG